VHTVDAATGRPRYLPAAEPSERVHSIFSTTDATHGYFLGAVDPGTGANRPGRIPPRPRHQPPGRRAIPAPQQGHLLHHLLSAIDGRAASTIPTTT